MADFYRCLKSFRYRRVLLHVELIYLHSVAHQFFYGAEHYRVRLGDDLSDVHRAAKSLSQSFSLPNGIKRIALMLAQHLALSVYKGTTSDLFFQAVHVALEKAPVVVIGHKTDFIAFCFLRQLRIAGVKGQLPHFRFGKFAQREAASVQCILRKPPKYIRLIFVQISGTADKAPSVLLNNPGIVASSDELTIESICPAQQSVPFDMRVAQDAGVGRPASHVFLNEVVDDVVAKLVSDVYDKVVEPHIYRYLACVVDRIQAATARFFFRTAGIGVVPGLHGDSHYLVARFVQ